MKLLPSLLIFLSLNQHVISQQSHLYCVAFYNVENLFDPENNPNTFDDDYTPDGRHHWTSTLLHQKINQLAKVMISIGQKETQNAPLIIGLAEVENRKVLELLIAHPTMRPFNYGIVHYESPDARGIDVALLYQKEWFIPGESKRYRLDLINPKTQLKRTTRDQLVVSGYLDEEPLHFLVNHWPSRRGGEKRSQSGRMAAARLQKRLIDSLQRLETEVKIIAMGDYNDDPINKSIQELVRPDKSGYFRSFQPLFNPMKQLYKRGLGSLAYRDRWHLFDQFLVSKPFLKKEGIHLIAAKIFSPLFLRTVEGNYKGYPFRNHINGERLEGYSDHFPVYLLFAKPL